MPRRDEPALDAREHRYGRGHKGVRAWEVTGDANDLTFVLVHGLGVSSSLFREVTDRLRHLGRVVVYDLPGFGGVPHPRDPMSIGEFASVMGASLIDLGITEPVLVGHSMGAQVAAELAARDPDRRRVVLAQEWIRDGLPCSCNLPVRTSKAMATVSVSKRSRCSPVTLLGGELRSYRW